MVLVEEIEINIANQNLNNDFPSLLETQTEANIPTLPCVTTNPNTIWEIEEIVGVVVTAILVPFILGSNFLVILAVSKFKRLQIPTNYFLVSLAAADIFIALVIPFVICVDILKDSISDIYLCLSPNRILMMACGVSILTLAAIAYDRYTALVNPLEYVSVMTVKKISILVSLSWIYSAAIAWLPLFSHWHEDIDIDSEPCSFRLLHSNAHVLFLSAVFAPACLAIFFCYFRIYIVARHHARAIAAVESSVRHNIQMRYIMKDTKYAKTLALVMGVFLFLWLPYLTCLFSEVIANVFVNDWIRNYLSFLAFLNSGVNPWVYAFKNNEFKAAFKRIFKEHCGKFSLCRSRDPRRPSVISDTSVFPASSSTVRLSRTNSRIASSEVLQTVAKLGEVTNIEVDSQFGTVSKLNNGFIPDLLKNHISGPHTKIDECPEDVFTEVVTESGLDSGVDVDDSREDNSIDDSTEKY
ncbi:histamine H2 receptor-like [Haliotis rufescens]|uniref:histamine H2 receptor-like n=1 Tax=Haliotis rufescens TaxID=6454 RepID=UPI00201F7D73|nr:histamine H2 receptor-like [Haliotis rufescens]